jgi:hypothetical protein
VGVRASILQYVVTMRLIARIDDEGHLELEKSWLGTRIGREFDSVVRLVAGKQAQIRSRCWRDAGEMAGG